VFFSYVICVIQGPDNDTQNLLPELLPVGRNLVRILIGMSEQILIATAVGTKMQQLSMVAQRDRQNLGDVRSANRIANQAPRHSHGSGAARDVRGWRWLTGGALQHPADDASQQCNAPGQNQQPK
jgi:hypothetical protein